MGLNYGPIFRRLWTKVHQITSADAGVIIVCNAVFRLSVSCSVPFRRYSRSKCEVVGNRAKNCMFFSPIFAGERGLKFFTQVFMPVPWLITWKTMPIVLTTVAKVISQNTLNFHANFVFYPPKPWSSPNRFRSALARLGHSLPYVKI